MYTKKEFSKYLLQPPSMTIIEQLFHKNQGLKNKIRIEVEKSDPKNLRSSGLGLPNGLGSGREASGRDLTRARFCSVPSLV